jgi:xylulokinase
MQADVFGIPVRRTTVDEGPAYGAALLAGVTAGVFKNVGEACSVVRLRPDFEEPNENDAQLYRRYLKVYRDLYPDTASAMARLSELSAYN